MTIKQNVVLNMWHAVNVSFTQFSVAVDSNTALRQKVDNFNASNDALMAHARQQTRTSKGITMDKENLRAQLEQQGYVVAANIKSWAKGNNDNKLAEDMHFRISALERLTDTQLLKTIGLVVENAVACAAALQPYGTTSAKLIVFQDTYKAYNDALGTSRNSINNKTNATLSIADLMEKGMGQLYELDELIHNVKDEYPDFLVVYFKARELVNLDFSHKRKKPKDPKDPEDPKNPEGSKDPEHPKDPKDPKDPETPPGSNIPVVPPTV